MRVIDMLAHGLGSYIANNPLPTFAALAYYLLRLGGYLMEGYLSEKAKLITDTSCNLVGIIALLLILTSYV